MISLRKLAFSFLAPIGALTIIGTGFATWVFGIQETPVVEGPINLGVGVTTEITNGDLELLTSPNLLVFSEGTQGKNNLFDGISFYTDKKINHGAELTELTELIVKMNDQNTTHRLSMVYDNTGAEQLLYFSWAKDKTTSLIIGGELYSENSSSFAGTRAGSVQTGENSYDVEIILTSDNSGSIEISQTVDGTSQTITNDRFTFVENDQLNDSKITITDSTFAFRYYNDNPNLINENETGYRLNVKLGMSLNSKEPFKIEFTKDGKNALIYQNDSSGTDQVSFKLSYDDTSKVYSLAAKIPGATGSPSQMISYTNLTFQPSENPGNDPVFKYGTYSGTSTSGITCELILSESATNPGTNFNATLAIGAMEHYLSLIDDFTSRVEDGYFNITSENNLDYAQTVLNIDIDRTHANSNERRPYIEFTCQLAKYLRYASSEVKPTTKEKYYGLRIASLLGGWEFRVKVSADFTAIRG